PLASTGSMASRKTRPARRCRGVPLRIAAAVQYVASATVPAATWMSRNQRYASMEILPLPGGQSRRRRGAGSGAAGHRSRVPEVTFCARRLARRHPGTQAGVMQGNWHERVDGLLSPLSLAAYAAWAAVWLAAGGAMAGDPALAWTLRAALVLFLLLFVVEHLVSKRLGMRGFL